VSDPQVPATPPGDVRVLLVVEQLRRRIPGGVGRYASGLVKGLSALPAPSGVAVTLYASRPPGPDPIAAAGFPVRTSALPGRALTRAWDHRWLCAPAGFDVVHSVSLAAPPPRRDRPVTSVVMVHDLAWRHQPAATTARGRRWHEAALARALEDAGAFVVPSAVIADELEAAGAPAEHVRVVAEGADHLPPPDGESTARLLAAHGVTGPYVLTVATLEPRKNLERLVAAFSLARPELPEPWPLVLVGPQGWGDALVPPDGVTLLGEVSDAELSGLYGGAALFAYVPLVEGFGLPPLEAMAAGVPTVVSRTVPSVGDGAGEPASRLVDPLDVDAIAAGLVAVAGDQELRARLVTAGRELAGRHTWRRTAEGHVALWESLR